MIQVELANDRVKEMFPITYNSFLSELRSSTSRSSTIEESKIKWSVSWGFFVKKAKTIDEKDKQIYLIEQKFNLPYEERIKVELPRIKCSLLMKAGFYEKVDRVFDETPDYVIDSSREILKYMMYEEQKKIQNPEVLESIRDFVEKQESLKENPENMSNVIDSLKQAFDKLSKTPKKKEFHIDEILDKISVNGIDSLDKDEIDFLGTMSKN